MVAKMSLSNFSSTLFERQEVDRLERGTAVYRFHCRYRPEWGNLIVQRETGQLLWQTTQTNSIVLASLREVKYIRPGKISKDFEKWPEDSCRHDTNKCFIIYYTTEFKYKTISVAALSERERQDWLEGLPYLVKEAQMTGHVTQFERLLRTLFYSVQNQEFRAGIREVRQLITRLHYDQKDPKVRILLRKIDATEREEINFDQFCEFVKLLLWEEQKNIFSEVGLNTYCRSDGVCSLSLFEKFLEAQGDPPSAAADLIKDAVRDVDRDVAQPYFHQDEFLQFLFSKANQIFDEKYVTQDMTRPLSHYFIASSHNTYLVGKQYSDESSVEAYIRALRQGCRCIELDTWSEKDGKIYIYHGYALTTKILLEDVLRAIRDHAFVTSPYPVILSIEDHCTLPHQREMARLLREIFGSRLVTEPIRKGETVAPSPEQLRGRILLKHRKQSEDVQFDASSPGTTGTNEDGGVEPVKRGILYRRHPVMHSQWQKHCFVLSSTRLYYTHACDDSDADQDNSLSQTEAELPALSRHLVEPWYHGRSAVTRSSAEELLSRHCSLGDGAFLVRKSENFIGDYTLSLWYRGQCHHSRIHSHQRADRTQYYIKEGDVFDSLYDLIQHYKEHPIYSKSIVTRLGNAVPQPNSHECMPWFHPDLDRSTAEHCLHRLNQDGVFLVRPSSKHAGQFAISFRANNDIMHCRITRKDDTFVLGSAEFESLVELVQYYRSASLYKTTRLRYPVPPLALQSILSRVASGAEDENESYYVSNVRVKAKQKYSAQQPDELTFPAHAIIHNVNQVHNDWWRGDYGGCRQLFFPANHVVVLPPDEPDEGVDQQLLGSLQQGSIDLLGASAVLQQTPGLGPVQAVLRITSGLSMLEVGFGSNAEAIEWLKVIKELSMKDEPLPVVQTRERQVVWSKQMSDLVIYFEAVNFNKNVAFNQGGVYNQVSSYTEQRIERLIDMYPQKMLQFHKVGFSRVYPKVTHVDSSNFNPIPMWCHGVQCVALNYQTGDKPMQLNHGLFMRNQGAGYVLRPDCHFDEQYNPADVLTLRNTASCDIIIKVLAGRHLTHNRKGTMAPFVEVELIGCAYESNTRHTTAAAACNGLCPVWNETIKLHVLNPQQALLRFVVYEEEVFEQVPVAQATFPLVCLRPGLRSVPLLNLFSEELELAALLVHYSVDLKPPDAVDASRAFNQLRLH